MKSPLCALIQCYQRPYRKQQLKQGQTWRNMQGEDRIPAEDKHHLRMQGEDSVPAETLILDDQSSELRVCF